MSTRTSTHSENHKATKMRNLNFLLNQNNKLDCKAFVAIRAHTKYEKLIENEIVAISLRDKNLFTAVVIKRKEILLEELSSFASLMDMGLDKDTGKAWIKAYNTHRND